MCYNLNIIRSVGGYCDETYRNVKSGEFEEERCQKAAVANARHPASLPAKRLARLPIRSVRSNFSKLKIFKGQETVP